MPIAINGTGTITGISAGGLPDAIIQPADLTQPLTLDIAKASTSGTNIDFTGIPSWVRRVTVMFSGVSTSGTNIFLIQLGTSSGFVTSGYVSTCCNTAATANSSSNTSGFHINNGSAAYTLTGLLTLVLVSSNTWVSSHTVTISSSDGRYGSGSIALSSTLDRIRITTVNGTDTFDAGTINILYE